MLYDDFKFLNYFRTGKKIHKVRELINRLTADAEMKIKRLDALAFSISELNRRIGINEELPEAPELLNLPNLYIKSIVPTYYSHYVDFKITVENNGEVATESNCILDVRINDIDIQMTVPELDVDENIVFYASYPFNPSGISESGTITVTADINGEIRESNENDNISKMIFEMKSSYVPPSGKGYIFVHCHNPEGREINSITGVVPTAVVIYDGDDIIGYGANNNSTHCMPIELDAGNHVIKVNFNGMTSIQNVNINSQEIKVLTFTFVRTETVTPNASYNYDSGIVAGIISSGTGDLFVIPSTAPPPAWWAFARIYYWDIVTGLSYSAQTKIFINGSNGQFSTNIFSSLECTLAEGYIKRDLGILFGGSGTYDLMTIPAKTGFTTWYTQGKYSNTGNLGTFYIAGDGSNHGSFIGYMSGISRVPIVPNNPGVGLYGLSGFSAASSHDIFYLVSTALLPTAFYYPPSHTAYEGYVNTLSDWHISSVPYDLDGNAV